MIRRCDRDAQRVLWYDDLECRNIAEYRFTRAIFGATSSPYILAATLEKHLEQRANRYSDTVKALRDDTYVDEIRGGGNSQDDVIKFKVESTEIMKDAGFVLHKWHSNCPSVESIDELNDCKTTYAKTMVGLPWDKKTAAINRVYDILGWSSPVLISAKLIFAEICLLTKRWDELLPDEIVEKWLAWIKCLQQQSCIAVPRSVVIKGGDMFEIHGFSVASKAAICAAIYVIEYWGTLPVNQRLLVAQSRVAPRNASIPRLELIAALMLARLQNNVTRALKNINIQMAFNWVDSITVLYWLANKGTFSLFVRNRVKQICELGSSEWLYVPTKDNPSDVGTRGASPGKLGELWFTGPAWLSSRDQWPKQPEILESAEAAEERIVWGTVSSMAVIDQDRTQIQEMLRKYGYGKLLRVTAYIIRFTNNAKGGKLAGCLKTEEIANAERLWLRHAQNHVTTIPSIELTTDADGILRVCGRIPGYRPIFVPRGCILDRTLVRYFHEQIGHGGVSSTMAKVRELFWVPQLRVLVKSIIHEFHKCHRSRVRPLHPPTTAPLLVFRTQMTHPFAVTGVDFAGPMLYRTSKRKTQKAYIALFTCATTRAVHLKLCKGMTAEEFKRSLKEFVARRRTPDKLVSDNAMTFKATNQWLNMLTQDENLFNYLNTQRIEWSFNLARAPWWGGFYEGMVGIMKASLSKVIGRALLKYEELEESLLDIECFMNNRPLCYQEEEIDHPVLTPNLLIHGTSGQFLDEDLDAFDEKGLVTKRMKFLKTCRQQLRKRWLTEYLHALEERHRKTVGKEQRMPTKGSVVVITDNSKIKSKWQIGRIIDTITGRDAVLRGYKIKTGTGNVVERPLQLVCDLEIRESNDEKVSRKDLKENDQVAGENDQVAGENEDMAPKKRPQGKAKTVAIDMIKGVSLNELED